MATDVDGPARLDTGGLDELDAERAFLLQSLRDLDAEWTAGDVDEHDYVALRDGYTKRAADVLRRIHAGRAEAPARRSAPWTKRAAVIAGVVAVAVLAGWLVARSSGQRLPGQEVSGNAPGDDIAGTLTRARMLLGTDPVQAIELYGDVLDERPDHAEAHAYRGWLFFVVSREADGQEQDELVAAARAELDAAVAADPLYADPHCFLAVLADAHDDDAETARAEADECLAREPPGEVRAVMDQFVESLSPDTTTITSNP